MPRAILGLAVALLLAGCMGAAAPAEDAALLTTATEEGDRALVTGDVRLGWIVGAGAHTAFGDTVVGLRTSEQCPEAWFPIPDGTENMTISISAATGAGPYDVSISSPGAIVFYYPLAGEALEHREEKPAAGLWSISFDPIGATAQQRWDVSVSYEHLAPLAAALAFELDPKCMP